MTVQIEHNLISKESAKTIIDILDANSKPTERDHVMVALGFEPSMAAKIGISENIHLDSDDLDITKAYQKSLKVITDFFGEDISLIQSFYNSMEPGASHGLHCDNCKLDGSPLEEGVEEPNKWSAILYLNDSDADFTGGSVLFPKQDLEIKPRTGDFIYFKTDVDHPHEVTKILSGERKCIVFFYGDRYKEEDPTIWIPRQKSHV